MPSNLQPGRGDIEARLLGTSTSVLSSLSSTYPLRFISPPSTAHRHAVLVFMLTYGGGLVAGDEIDVHIKVSYGARFGLLTQGSTKIFKPSSSEVCTKQTLTAIVEARAALLILPDPVQPFKGSVYQQCQTFKIDPVSSSLLLLDWVSEGRAAREEAWSLSEWEGRNAIWSLSVDGDDGRPIQEGNLLLRDNVILRGTSSTSEGSLSQRMDSMGIFGTLIIKGPIFQGLGEFFLKEFELLPRIGEMVWSTDSSYPSLVKQSRAARQRRETKSGLIWTAAPTRGFVIIKFGAKQVDDARRWLRDMLTEDGTVEKEYGERYLLCLG